MSVHGQMLRSIALAALAPSLAISLLATPAHAQNLFLSGGQETPKASADPTQKVARGYITVNAEPAIGGVKLIVETFQDRLNSAVVLSLGAAIANPNGVGGQNKGTVQIPLKLLSTGVADPTYYHQKQEFFLSYAELQKQISDLAPNAPNLRIEPGMAMVVKADFPGGHNWGGFDRGGVFFLPPPLDAQGKPMVMVQPAVTQAAAAPAGRPSALDLAFNIPTTMTNIYNDRSTGAGLKPGGQKIGRAHV